MYDKMELTTILCFTIVCISVHLLALLVIKRKRVHKVLQLHGIPGPKPDFFAGNLVTLRKGSTPDCVITSWLREYGDIFGYYIGEDIYVVVKDLEVLKKVLVKDFKLFINRPDTFLKSDPYPKTLVGLRNNRWKDVRRIISQSFTSGKLKRMTDVISDKVEVVADLISKKAVKNEMFDIFSILPCLVLDTMTSSSLAMKTMTLTDKNDAFLLAIQGMFGSTYNKVIEYGIKIPFARNVLQYMDYLSTYKISMNVLRDILKKLIRDRETNPDFHKDDVLQALLNHCKGGKKNTEGIILTEEEVIANVVILLLAGFRTTATSVAYTLYVLVKYPEIQERLYQEIIQAKDSSHSTIQSLSYLDQVYKESLRLYPPVTSFASRISSEDYNIGPITIPKGANVVVPVQDIHHDPDLWPDPWNFDPDRFSAVNKGSIQRMSFMPFGDGPRNCVGGRFAILIAKMTLIKLLKQFKFHACEKTEDELSLKSNLFIVIPENGIWLKATPRVYAF